VLEINGSLFGSFFRGELGLDLSIDDQGVAIGRQIAFALVHGLRFDPSEPRARRATFFYGESIRASKFNEHLGAVVQQWSRDELPMASASKGLRWVEKRAGESDASHPSGQTVCRRPRIRRLSFGSTLSDRLFTER
jgi:hypothetical protein